MAQAVSITANPIQMERLQKSLDPKQFRQALWQATKRTTKAAVKLVNEAVQYEMNLNPKYIGRYIKAKMERGDVPVGTIMVSGKSIPLIQFDYKPKIRATKRGGIIVTTLRDKPPIILKHGFKAIVQSPEQESQGIYHKGVFLRKKLGTISKIIAKTKLAKRGHGVTASGFASRFPIVQQRAKSIPNAISIPTVEKKIKGTIGAVFEKNIDSQIRRFVEGGGVSAQDIADFSEVTTSL
jgi:hypothetical protein